jgi:hypothetical protein
VQGAQRRPSGHSAAVEGAAVVRLVARAAPATAPQLPYRIGHGFDLHRMEDGYNLIIGGIKIPHTKGCVAHSDGDVLLHCVCDSILGVPATRMLCTAMQDVCSSQDLCAVPVSHGKDTLDCLFQESPTAVHS